MYENINARMVEAGVAELLDHEIHFEREGNEDSDVEKAYGRPTKYRVSAVVIQNRLPMATLVDNSLCYLLT